MASTDDGVFSGVTSTPAGFDRQIGSRFILTDPIAGADPRQAVHRVTGETDALGDFFVSDLVARDIGAGSDDSTRITLVRRFLRHGSVARRWIAGGL